MLDPFHLQTANNQTFERKYKPVNKQSRSPKKNIFWYGTHKLPKTVIFIFFKYQTETAIFLATRHEKTIMACSYLKFYKYFLHYELLANNTIKNESIHLNSWHHSLKKQKDSLEARVVLLIFSLELEISGVAVQRIHQNSEKW